MSDFLAIKRRRTTRNASGRRRRYRHSRRAEKPMAATAAYFRRHILLDADIAGGKDGYYTWIYKDTPLLAAGRARSEQELGTLHANLDALTVPGKVVAAGEFYKQGSILLFNLQSGSYMAAVFRKLKTMPEKLAKRNELLALAIEQFMRLGLVATFNAGPPDAEPDILLAGNPMIDTADIPTTLSNIAEYNRLLSHSSEA
jgi:hypothetical protein